MISVNKTKTSKFDRKLLRDINGVRNRPDFVPTPRQTVQFGYLRIQNEQLMLFVDHQLIAMDRVAFLCDRLNDRDADSRFPRPFKLNDDGGFIEEGDILALIVIESADYDVVVLGSVMNNNDNPFQLDIETGYERRVLHLETPERVYAEVDNGKGEYATMLTGLGEDGTGNMFVAVKGATDEHGRFTLTVSKDVVIYSPKIYLGDELEDEPVVLGRSLVEKLSSVLDALKTTGNITTPSGVGQFNPTTIKVLTDTRNSIEDVLSKRNFTV